MKLKFAATFYRWILLATLGFGLTAPCSAQTPATNASPETFQPQPPASLPAQMWQRVHAIGQFEILGQPLSKFVLSFIYVLLAFFVAKFLDYIVNAWLKRWAAKTETKLDDLLLDLLHGPVKVVAFVIFLHIGLNALNWPVAMRMYLSKTMIIIVACSVTYVSLKVVDLLLSIWREHHASEDKLFTNQLLPLIRKSAKAAIIVGAILLTAENIGWDIKTLLAGLSVGGLALGLAAQDTIANVFGAVSIILDKPFHIGDRIRVESVEGDVESIGLRSTRVRNLDGHHVSIPNKMMGNVVIINVTRRPNIKTEMNFGLTYDTPADKVKRAIAVLEEIFRAHPKTSDLIISFNKFNDSSLNIFVIHWWNGLDAKAHFADMQELNLAIKRRFDAEKIEFAFPTQTVYVKQDAAGKPQD